MSVNKYMHPRNIYKNRPNFKELAIQYPDFRKYVQQDITGKVSLDFKNVEALRALSRTLLLKDFELNVEIPENKLIPTIPLRLNYLLWIEDLLNIQKSNSEKTNGIDIGTGASCVYPLIAAKKFKWFMIGTEINQESIQCAKRNITENLLEDYIQIFPVTQDDILLKEVISTTGTIYDFCMCNPPFFSSSQELHPFFKSRKANRPHPKNAFCASVDEVLVKGGEVEFISRLIMESSILRDRITIFTTMVGHKSNLVQLKALLRKVEVQSFKQSEFCQGNTTRWGLAWTFQDIDLRTIPKNILKKPHTLKQPLSYVIPDSGNGKYKIEYVNVLVMKLVTELKLEVRNQEKSRKCIAYNLIARSNTWCNQRKKRREKLKQTRNEHLISSLVDANENSMSVSQSPDGKESKDCNYHVPESNNYQEMNNSSSSDKTDELQDAFEKIGMDITPTTSPKRKLEDEDQYYSKKFKEDDTTNNNKYPIEFFFTIKQQNDQIRLELFPSDQKNREIIHQILQYIKNNWE